MSNAYIRFAGNKPGQTEQALPNQVKNNAGGFVFQVSDATRLERFLILGSTGPTYYQSEEALTKQNVDDVIKLCVTNPQLVISTVRSITTERRALRVSPAIFTVALLLSNIKNYKSYTDPETKQILRVNEEVYREARKLLLDVCKTGTQLFEFIAYIELLQEAGKSGWSAAKRKAVAEWYESKSAANLAYQMAKYRSRSFGGDTITHADALRLSHAKIDEVLARFVGRWYKDTQNAGITIDERTDLDVLRAHAVAMESDNEKRILDLLDQPYAKVLSWEMLPTTVLRSADVWKKLFYNGQVRNQALIRNVTRMARIGAFDDMNFTRDYANKLVAEATGLHPLNFLNTILVYSEGQVERDPKKPYFMRRKPREWSTNPVIMDALNNGYYEAFKKVQPSGKRIFLGLDVSGSMSSFASGLDMTCAQLCGAMAMAIARTENNYIIKGFASTNGDYWKPQLIDLGISATTDLMKAFSNVRKSNFGATDCALPMVWAAKNNIEVDTFVVLTDNETWSGGVHPYKALEDYRQKTGINAGQIVVAATATPFTIANPNDPKTLDVVGADSHLPKLVSEFC